MALTPQQIAEAQNWISSSGYGSFAPGGGFSLGSGGDNAAYGILGAAQSMGYNPADVSQITGGAYTPEQISTFLGTNQPQVDTYQSVFEADKSRANVPTMPQTGGNQFTTPPTLGGYQKNPYLDEIAGNITQKSQQALGQSLNMLDSGAIGTGGFGGARQGVAQGLATSRANEGLSGNLANLYGTDYTNSMNRDLQKYGIDTNAFLTNQGQNQNFYTAQRGQDLAQIGLGSTLDTQALQNQWYPIQQYANIVGNLSGQNTSTTNSTQQGGGALGALGGLLGTAQIGSNMKWW